MAFFFFLLSFSYKRIEETPLLLLLQYHSKVSRQSQLDPQNSILASRTLRLSSFETRESRIKDRESRTKEFSNMQTRKEVRGNYLFLEETTIAVHIQYMLKLCLVLEIRMYNV